MKRLLLFFGLVVFAFVGTAFPQDVTPPVISNLGVNPNPFTPNGDGINDIAEISYDILQIIGTAPAEVAIYDLSGRRLRTVHRSASDSGRYLKQWDGTDGEGHLVAPGIYVVQISLETDRNAVTKTKSVSVVY